MMCCYVSGFQDNVTMGASFALDREVTKARQRSEEIDKQLAELAKQDQNIVKILLLGE